MHTFQTNVLIRSSCLLRVSNTMC